MTSIPRRVWISCVLVIVLAAAAGIGYAQVVGAQVVAAQPVVPAVVFSGADIGFRMTARKGDTPVGRLVVRVNGEWKEVESPFGVRPLSQ